jgi:two-component system chemotaxis response regulator CheB
MDARRVVVIGASSGGIDAVRLLLGALPESLPAAICVVIHTAADSPGGLDGILRRASRLPVANVGSGARLEAGRVYVARPDHHLLLEPGVLVVSKGPKENRFRPAIDPLFRSAAQVYGPAAIGVILTGNLDDGTSGLWAIKRLGGTAVVQDPDDAQFPSMPSSAMAHVDVDHVVKLAEMPALLERLLGAPSAEREADVVPKPLEIEVNIAKAHNAVDAGVTSIGTPSNFSCPECHGVLLRLDGGLPQRYRCHTGHAYSADSLVAAVGESIEAALWNAARALEEGGLVLNHLAEHFRAGQPQKAAALAAQALAARRDSEAVRAVVNARTPLRADAKDPSASP